MLRRQASAITKGVVYPDDTAEPDVLTRSIEDDYRIEWGKRLGEGTDGHVVLCRDIRTQQRCALKYMPVSNSSIHELRMLHYCTVHAPDHITNLIAAYENELTFADAPHQPIRYHLLVLEYMAGGDLLRFISRSNFAYTERVASGLFGKMAECVHVLHSLNIAHRDIKPENVLLSGPVPVQGEIPAAKLTDLAFADFDRYNLRTECGTPEYQAPETQSAGRMVGCRRGGCYTRACDMWSLGASLYLILSGTFPFEGYDVQKKIKQQYNFPDSGWDIISEEARRVVTLLLCGPPRNRLTSQRLLEEDFVTHPERLPEVPLQTSHRIQHCPSGFEEGRSHLDEQNFENRLVEAQAGKRTHSDPFVIPSKRQAPADKAGPGERQGSLCLGPLAARRGRVCMEGPLKIEAG